jgi:hypothetical protein
LPNRTYDCFQDVCFWRFFVVLQQCVCSLLSPTAPSSTASRGCMCSFVCDCRSMASAALCAIAAAWHPRAGRTIIDQQTDAGLPRLTSSPCYFCAVCDGSSWFGGLDYAAHVVHHMLRAWSCYCLLSAGRLNLWWCNLCVCILWLAATGNIWRLLPSYAQGEQVVRRSRVDMPVESCLACQS